MPAEESEMNTAPAPTAHDRTLDVAAQAGRLLTRLRAERTRVHAITNAAAQVLTANLLLAAGAIPSLTAAADEVPAFVTRAGALLINLGTLDGERRAAIPWAIASARAAARPWVLDPVFVDASPARRDLARLCLAGHPSVLRCNAAEFAALAEREPTVEGVREYAAALQAVVALTGPVDHVTDGTRSLLIENGHALMARTTAMGCAATALVAAFVALAPEDMLGAAAAALVVIGVAGEMAGETAGGPGSFPAAFLDVVDALDPAIIERRARVRAS
jgi:hydroxyethylthiazole kinase